MSSYLSFAVRWSVVVAVVASVGCGSKDQPPVDTTAAAVSVDSAAKTTADSSPATLAAAPVSGAMDPAMAAPSDAKSRTTPKGPSTRVGVYTAEQAERGEAVYGTSCRSCHSPTSHTGQVFADWWQAKPVSDLYNFIAINMPKNDPGTLAPEDVADVVAFLLKMNEMPTGKTELYPDADSLKRFWIDTRRGGR